MYDILNMSTPEFFSAPEYIFPTPGFLLNTHRLHGKRNSGVGKIYSGDQWKIQVLRRAQE